MNGTGRGLAGQSVGQRENVVQSGRCDVQSRRFHLVDGGQSARLRSRPGPDRIAGPVAQQPQRRAQHHHHHVDSLIIKSHLSTIIETDTIITFHFIRAFIVTYSYILVHLIKNKKKHNRGTTKVQRYTIITRKKLIFQEITKKIKKKKRVVV